MTHRFLLVFLALPLPVAACSTPAPALHQETSTLLQGEWAVESPDRCPLFLSDGFRHEVPRQFTNPPPLAREALERTPSDLRLVFLGGRTIDANDANGALVVRLAHPDFAEERTYVTTYALHLHPDGKVSLDPNRSLTIGEDGYEVRADGDTLVLIPVSAGDPSLRLRRPTLPGAPLPGTLHIPEGLRRVEGRVEPR